jgi:hypothetical protein
MRYLLCLLLLSGTGLQAQIPRNDAGFFEYSHKVTVDDADARSLKDKARQFFNQPFLVHWDSVYDDTGTVHLVMKGKGYVDVRAKLHSISTSRNIPVSFDFTLEVDDGGYKYTWSNFEVNNPDNGIHFEFEKKPDSLKQITYDQLLSKTQKRISYVTGYLRRYMKGEE